ncbi:MAG: GAF domain-containing protein [Chloroflexota bacterium]
MSRRLDSLQRIKWVAIFAPPLFLIALEILRTRIAQGFFGTTLGYALLAGIVLLASLGFALVVFGYVERVQLRLREQNRELLALHEAGLAVTSDLDLNAVLHRVVDEARELAGAQYGLLALVDERGKIIESIPSGMDQETIDRLGEFPEEHGMISLLHYEGRPLRLDDLREHPASRGFPEGHPIMRSLLGVPITSHGRVLGSLVLTEQQGRGRFDAMDEVRLERFATQAAVAIENARLHEQVYTLAVIEERERIAREMHDSLAQVLGYVNTKAQAVNELMQAGKQDRAATHLEQLAAAAREAYTDVRENILGLRSTGAEERDFIATLLHYVEQWEEQSGINVERRVSCREELSERVVDLVALQTLRIVQEALTNVRKHARATKVLIEIGIENENLTMVIEDNGVGFDPEALERTGLPRFGLTIMRERALSIGGELTIEPAKPGGARVQVRVPLNNWAT